MRKLGLISLVASAMLFVAFGAASLSADEQMGGKCGKKKEMKNEGKCGKKKEMKSEGKCGKKKEMKQERDDEDEMEDEEKQSKRKSMKCGVGKCG